MEELQNAVEGHVLHTSGVQEAGLQGKSLDTHEWYGERKAPHNATQSLLHTLHLPSAPLPSPAPLPFITKRSVMFSGPLCEPISLPSTPLHSLTPKPLRAAVLPYPGCFPPSPHRFVTALLP